ncbi:helix-turn-helix domain-containing protein [Mycobacterium asiaticum]|uniref:GIY-YIG catalytic domain-containing protein n=1 Tax=Mycobacterium asiaticum TaxID=1790 RepID=A0A1A3NDH0_MYCAS|nr:helix-turn-helix domain-containing protein [Mycobacterium asiaticum]OBK19340.1 hypothetical protein A5636_18215 [Mycobacterium asiaticum]
MTPTVSIEGSHLRIAPFGSEGQSLLMSVDEWRVLSRTVDAVIDDGYVSYDEAAARLGVHRSTLTDWIAQGRLQKCLIAGRGYVTAKSLKSVEQERNASERVRPASIVTIEEPRSKSASWRPAAGNAGPPAGTPIMLSAEALTLVRALTREDTATEPRRFPVDPAQAAHPGMYSWWGDDEARAVLGEEVGMELPRLLYAGQAGATKWPSGTKSAATLGSRIGTQHIKGNARSSTFRLTISSLLSTRLSLVPIAGGKLDPASNALISEWIADHLRVVIAPFDDRDALRRLEEEVVTHLNPPLNLEHCPPTEARARISRRRRDFGR